MSPPVLSDVDLAVAACLVLAGAALSWALALGVHRPLLIASVRMVVQLVLVGHVLRWLFAASSPWLTAAALLVMVAAASREVGARGTRRLAGAWHYGVGAGTVTVAAMAVTLVALGGTALRPHPWDAARQIVPVFGIVLGTVMNAGSLAFNALFTALPRERAAIEARLALGAPFRLACRDVARAAVLAGVIPTLNQMAAAGLITLPGIMTGQVLAGMDPLEAARTQILLMFVLTGGGFLAGLLAVEAALRRLTDDRDRLRLDRLVDRP